MRRIIGSALIFLFLFLVIPGLMPQSDLVMAQSSSATCTSPYTVQSGDTLSGIAQKCSVDFSSLVTVNTNFTNRDLIFPGQTVVIPQVSVPVTGGTNAGSGTYTVVTGDTLSGIAQRKNTNVQAILKANTWINNSNLIFPGWVITLPSGSSSSSSSGSGSTTGSTTGSIPATGGRTYTVVAGDTLSGIAQRYNTTPAAIVNANNWITNANVIVPGWVLVIP